MSFKEDMSQIRIGHAAENLALIRRLALNLLKQEQTHLRGITCRRKTAGGIITIYSKYYRQISYWLENR